MNVQKKNRAQGVGVMNQTTIPDKLYFKIGEVSEIVGVRPYVLRYWETEFKNIDPVKSRTNQRLYKKKDVEFLVYLKNLLHHQRYTIKGARAQLKSGLKNKNEEGVESQLGFALDSESSLAPPVKLSQDVMSGLKAILKEMQAEARE